MKRFLPTPLFRWVTIALGILSVAGPGRAAAETPTPVVNADGEPLVTTFSIVACDPETGEVGAAVASLYPAVGRVVPWVKAGAGAFCTQYYLRTEYGPRALELLDKHEMRPEEILAVLVEHDTKPEERQLAIVDMQGRAVNRNPVGARPNADWWGGATGKHYAVQGNTLVARKVIVEMAAAYEETKGTVADRLMAALKAGDDAGGDHRGRLAAGIRVAKPGVEGLWCELYVDKSDDAVNDLVKEYAKWKALEK
jgi:uncharacterized Ntn-hydrolase superfamily protein